MDLPIHVRHRQRTVGTLHAAIRHEKGARRAYTSSLGVSPQQLAPNLAYAYFDLRDEHFINHDGQTTRAKRRNGLCARHCHLPSRCRPCGRVSLRVNSRWACPQNSSPHQADSLRVKPRWACAQNPSPHRAWYQLCLVSKACIAMWQVCTMVFTVFHN